MELAAALRAAGGGRVLVPGEDGFDAQLQVFDLTTSVVPDVVVAATGTADVRAAIEVAAARGVPLAVLGTGHGMLRDVAGGILLTTRGLAGVAVDRAARTARIGAGTTWSEVLAATAPYGLAGLCGSAPGVGVIGYLLGGGLGPLGRSHGYAADHVRSIEIVTPAHGPITATAEDHAELFWALRGGKGGFGVVTAVTIDLFPIASVYGGGLYFGDGDAAAVLDAFAGWAPALPESVTASVALLRLPPLPVLPEPIRGRFVVHLRVASLDAPARAEELLAPMRAAGSPLLDAVGVLPVTAIGAIHSDPTEPMPADSASATLTAFGADAVAALLEVAGPGVELPLAAVEVRALGGALARQPEIPNAVGARDAAANLFLAGAPVPGLGATAIPRAVDSVLDAMRPWTGPHYLANFVGRANAPDAIDHAWDAAQRERLDGVRAAADPGGLFPFAGHGRRQAGLSSLGC